MKSPLLAPDQEPQSTCQEDPRPRFRHGGHAQHAVGVQILSLPEEAGVQGSFSETSGSHHSPTLSARDNPKKTKTGDEQGVSLWLWNGDYAHSKVVDDEGIVVVAGFRTFHDTEPQHVAGAIERSRLLH